MRSLWMLVSGFLFACMGVLVKLSAVYFSSIELVFYRSMIGFLIICVIVSVRHLPLSTLYWKNHCWRGLSGLGSVLMFFYCITQLPLATAVTLNYTSPLFLTLLTTMILKDHFQWLLAVAVVLGFAGVVLLLRPSLQEDQWSGGLIGLASGFFCSHCLSKYKAPWQFGRAWLASGILFHINQHYHHQYLDVVQYISPHYTG